MTLQRAKATILTTLGALVVFALTQFWLLRVITADPASDGRDLGGMLMLGAAFGISILFIAIVFPLAGGFVSRFKKQKLLYFLFMIGAAVLILAIAVFSLSSYSLSLVWFLICFGALAVLTLPFVPVWWWLANRALKSQVK